MFETIQTGEVDLTRDNESVHYGWGGSTDWTVLTVAAQGGCEDALEALNRLCLRYINPIRAYICRRGHAVWDAEDLTQEFLQAFMKKEVLEGLEESKGRFRSLLLVSLKNFLATMWARKNALKRGGGQQVLSLEVLEEECYCAVAPSLTPEEVYDRRWALTVLDEAMAHLEKEEIEAGRGVEFKRLRRFLTGDGEGDNYRAAARDLKIRSDAVAMKLHRLRLRYRAALRATIACTVNPEQVEQEMRTLMLSLVKYIPGHTIIG